MSDKKNIKVQKYNLSQLLLSLGLRADESTVYVELLRDPRSHLELSRATGINRTKIYRVCDELEKRSLVSTVTDDRGTFLHAASPESLEVSVVETENKLKNQKTALGLALPRLKDIEARQGLDPLDFTVHTYDGADGFKQMLWNELKAKGEAVIFGSGAIEDLVGSKRWSEKHRAKTLDAGYTIRELLNPRSKPEGFTSLEEFHGIYNKRFIDRSTLPLDQQIAIYNDTVATYHWRDDQKVGVEIVNAAYANTMRAIFEQYWATAKQD